jgi:hypothetical protein
VPVIDATSDHTSTEWLLETGHGRAITVAVIDSRQLQPKPVCLLANVPGRHT